MYFLLLFLSHFFLVSCCTVISHLFSSSIIACVGQHCSVIKQTKESPTFTNCFRPDPKFSCTRLVRQLLQPSTRQIAGILKESHQFLSASIRFQHTRHLRHRFRHIVRMNFNQRRVSSRRFTRQDLETKLAQVSQAFPCLPFTPI